MKKLMISFLFTGLILFNVNSVFACDCGCKNDECNCKKECLKDCDCGCQKGEKCNCKKGLFKKCKCKKNKKQKIKCNCENKTTEE